jgi:hypothetical protein
MYQRYYCHHKACTNIAAASIQHVPTSLLSPYSMYQHCYCQHRACSNVTTVTIQHVPTSLLSANSMYQHHYCHHTACTNITTVSKQYVPTSLLSAYSTYLHHYCQQTARSTNITTVSIQHVPQFLLPSYGIFQHYFCQHTSQYPALFLSAHITISSTISVSTRHKIQHVLLSPICATKHSDIALTVMQLPQYKRKATPIIKQHKGNVAVSKYVKIALTWHIISLVRVVNWVTGSHPLSNGY